MSADLQSQERYVERMLRDGFKFPITVGDAFVRGMREIGYKHTGTALDELIDNGIQAGASNVHVILGYGSRSDAKPSSIAVLDDGHGMVPDMVRLAVLWGGTHRENDRSGFGRFGYGLPSACVSQCRRFTVFSRVDEGTFFKVTVDLDDIAAGKYDNDGLIVVPQAEKAPVPKWIAAYLKEKVATDSPVRTIVVLEKLDRLSWTTTKGLQANLHGHFGVTYRNLLREVRLTFDGKPVMPVDPLFLTPGARFFDLDDERASGLEPLQFEVKDRESGNVVGVVKVRYSRMPPTFQRADKSKERGRMNARHAVMKEHNGIIVLRQGRQIDVVTRCPWTTFTIYDRNWAIEVDFPATLDEEFRITTSKQQVILSDRMWELLREQGVYRAIEQMRKEDEEARRRDRRDREVSGEDKRPSEVAMEEAQKFLGRRPGESPEREQKARESLQVEAKRRSRESGVAEAEVERQLISETEGRPYKVEERSSAGAPFFRPEQRGGQLVLILNTADRFYKQVYAAPDASPRLRDALEVLLFAIGAAEADSSDDRQTFYETERVEWTRQLNVALARLDQIHPAEVESRDEALGETQTMAAS